MSVKILNNNSCGWIPFSVVVLSQEYVVPVVIEGTKRRL